MANIGLMLSPTIELLRSDLEKNADKNLPYSLEIESCGSDCQRKKWFQFHWVLNAKKSAEELSINSMAESAKDRILDRLYRAGVNVKKLDHRTDKKWKAECFNGHVAGEIDAIIMSGLPDSPNKEHILFVSSMSDSEFKDIGEKGILNHDIEKFRTIQVYMFLFGIERAFFVAENRNTGELFTDRVRLDKNLAGIIIGGFESVIQANTMPDAKTKLECDSCTYKALCDGESCAAKNCRTCLHSTPLLDGDKVAWKCERYNQNVPAEYQSKGCDNHLFIPCLVTYGECLGVDGDDILYQADSGKHFKNVVVGGKGYTSEELTRMNKILINDDVFTETKDIFNATVTG